MRVTPAPAAAGVLHVAVGDVHASDVARGLVDDDELAVVAPVDAVGKLREGHLEERVRLDAGLVHHLEEPVSRRETAHVVIHHLDLDAFGRLAHQNLRDLMAERVVEEDVILQIDRPRGAEQIGLEGRELVLARGEYVDLVVDRVERRRQVAGKLDERAVGAREVLRVQIDVARGHGGNDLALVHARDHMLAAQAAPEEEVEHEPHEGEEYQRDHPRQRADRVAVLLEDHDDAADHHHRVGGERDRRHPPVYLCHRLQSFFFCLRYSLAVSSSSSYHSLPKRAVSGPLRNS